VYCSGDLSSAPHPVFPWHLFEGLSTYLQRCDAAHSAITLLHFSLLFRMVLMLMRFAGFWLSPINLRLPAYWIKHQSFFSCCRELLRHFDHDGCCRALNEATIAITLIGPLYLGLPKGYTFFCALSDILPTGCALLISFQSVLPKKDNAFYLFVRLLRRYRNTPLF